MENVFNQFHLPSNIIATLIDQSKLPVSKNIDGDKYVPGVRCCSGCGGCCDDDCAAGNTVG